MKLNQLLEATHSNQPDVRVIARWLDVGMANSGILEDWDNIIADYQADDLYSESEIWEIIDEWNVCIRFIAQTLGTTSGGNVISDEQAQRVIGQPRS